MITFLLSSVIFSYLDMPLSSRLSWKFLKLSSLLMTNFFKKKLFERVTHIHTLTHIYAEGGREIGREEEMRGRETYLSCADSLSS